MGASATPIAGLPPLPPGAVLNGSTSAPKQAVTSTGLPPLPPGASLNAAPQTTQTQQQPSALQSTAQAVQEAPIDLHKGIAKGAMHTVAGLMNLLNSDQGSYDPAAAQAYLQSHPGAKPEEALEKTMRPGDPQGHVHLVKRAADWLNAHSEDHGVWQHIGDLGESAAELMTPEALGALGKGAELTKAGEVATAADKYAKAAETAKVLNKFPRIRALVTMGLAAAARAGGEVGTQTLVKTGGDVDAATRAGTTAAVIGGIGTPLLAGAGELASGAVKKVAAKVPETRMVEGVEVPVPKAEKLAPGQAEAGAAYTQTAKAAAQGHLEKMGLDAHHVNAILDKVHDFTGAGDALTELNNNYYDTLDHVTDGKFRALNDQVKAAQKAAWDGGPPAEQVYQNKLREMDNLLDNSRVSPDLLGRVKASWTQSYVLKDMGKTLDKAIDGIPGDSVASQTYRGMNGKTLQAGLRTMVNRYGRDNVETALGGPARLKNLQAIADATKTNAQRQQFNYGVRRIAEWLPAYVGYKVGEHAGGVVGGIAGAGATEAAMVAAKRVYSAVATNPKIGQQLVFAIESGARPERYAPFIGAMIQQSEAEKANAARKAEQ